MQQKSINIQRLAVVYRRRLKEAKGPSALAESSGEGSGVRERVVPWVWGEGSDFKEIF